MSKRINAKYKISRSLGANLWGRAKDPFEAKNYAPGQHGPLRRRVLSDYGKQLAAKQKLRKYYGNITEKQFRSLYKEAVRRKGDTGENLIGLLESRLDAFIYRAGIVPTVYSARQIVSHRHIEVNGQRVNIPSYRLKVGDVVSVKEKSRQIPVIAESLQSPERDVPEYIELDAKAFSATYKFVPTLADVPYPVTMETNLVIEYYSR